MKSEYNKALDEVAALKAKVDELIRARSDAEAQAIELSQRLSEIKTGQSAVTKAEVSRWALPLLGLIAFLLTGLLAVLRFQSEAFLQKWDLDGLDKVVLLVVLAIYAIMGAPSIYGKGYGKQHAAPLE